MMDTMQKEVQGEERTLVRKMIIEMEQEAVQEVFQYGPNEVPSKETRCEFSIRRCRNLG